ncbi:MAG: SDR family oxidoreductase [Acidobacteriota bacterium]
MSRTALITGATGGIGRAICQRLAGDGYRIAVHYRSRADVARQLVGELPGGPHVALAAELGDPDAVASLVDEAVSTFGRLDLLVNNAGVFDRHPLAEVDYDTWLAAWRRTLDSNLFGAANACWCAGKHMIEQGGGRIVNISSRGAFRGEPESPAYGASKAGLNALSQSLAQALAPHGIYVYAIAPGFVETAMARPWLTGEKAEAIRQQSPLGRVARADDVAYWVAAMAHEDANFATGTIIDVNGASYLRS